MDRDISDPRADGGQQHVTLERVEPQRAKLRRAASVRHAEQHTSGELAPEEPLARVIHCLHRKYEHSIHMFTNHKPHRVHYEYSMLCEYNALRVNIVLNLFS